MYVFRIARGEQSLRPSRDAQILCGRSEELAVGALGRSAKLPGLAVLIFLRYVDV